GRRSQQVIERAVFVIGLEQTIEREKGRQERRDPEDAGRDRGQSLTLGADAERKQRNGDDEKREHRGRIAALTQREAQIAPQERAETAHAARAPAAASASAFWPGNFSARCVETTARPPAAQ